MVRSLRNSGKLITEFDDSDMRLKGEKFFKSKPNIASNSATNYLRDEIFW